MNIKFNFEKKHFTHANEQQVNKTSFAKVFHFIDTGIYRLVHVYSFSIHHPPTLNNEQSNNNFPFFFQLTLATYFFSNGMEIATPARNNGYRNQEGFSKKAK